MSKAVRWQVPFAAHDGTRYRVDIYDEGYTGNPVVLTAGETPFTTDEDDSDDFFAPVRTQTGTLQVCTDIEGSNTPLKLEDILPANNIARPVRLLNLDNSNAIEWQGFLSCEAYSQDYIGIPQLLDLPLIGVLEAMDSVQVEQTALSGLNSVSTCIGNILDMFEETAEISYFNEYYMPSLSCGRNIVSKEIDASVLYEQKEYNNENSTTYIVSGLSLKECLQRIAVYMGWCIREKSRTLYFMAAHESSGYRRYYQMGQMTPGGELIKMWMIDMSDTAISTQDIDDLEWMGTGHQRTVVQGAKSVEVVAKLEEYELSLQVPDCPVGSLSESYNSLNSSQYLYELGNSNAQAYSNCTFAYYGARCFTSFTYWEAYWQDNFANVFSHMAAGGSSTAKSYSIGTRQFSFYAGAFLSRYSWENSGSATVHDVKNALHCVFFPRSINAGWEPNASNFDETKVGAIFSISAVNNYRCNSGYICITADADTIFMLPEDPKLKHYTDLNHEWLISVELKFGDKYWNGGAWQSSRCQFYATMTKNGFRNNWSASMPIKETDGLLIPITSEMSGIVTFKIWPLASAPSGYAQESQATLEMLFKKLDVYHILPDDARLSDRSENHYFRLLGTHFRDEVSISTELASSLNNLPSPSLIMEDATTPMTMLNYGSSQSPDMRRPEADLLNRLATYYGAARQRLELEVAHITTPLPMLRLNGINDGKVYLPLAEERDWRTGVCKLTCFECPS